MKLKIFVSYSSKDKKIVEQLASSHQVYADFYYWDKSKEPSQEAWHQIEGWISNCDLFIVIITGHTVQRGLSVGKEVGIAKSQKKRILPIISNRVPANEITFLEGITYQSIDLFSPDEAIQSITNITKDLYNKKKLEQEALVAQKHHIQLREEYQFQLDEFKIAIAVVVVIIGFILLARRE